MLNGNGKLADRAVPRIVSSSSALAIEIALDKSGTSARLENECESRNGRNERCVFVWMLSRKGKRCWTS